MSEMSKQAKGGNGQEKKSYKFMVDNKPREADQPVLTGAQIKALAQVDPSFGLFAEGRGNQPDQQIADGQAVDLREPGRDQFYTVAPATFGGER